MFKRDPTASEIRTANRNAVGGGRKRCRKGKNCSATCIDAGKACLVGLPEPVSQSMPKISNFLRRVLGRKEKNPGQEIPENPKQPAEKPKRTQLMSEDDRENLYFDRQANNKKLDIDGQFALQDYSEDKGVKSFRSVNKCLRNPKACGRGERSEVKEQVKEMDEALRVMDKNPELQPFWRGVSTNTPGGKELYKFLESAKPGTKLTDNAYSSYSWKEDVAKKFFEGSSGILFVSRNPNLTPMNQYSRYAGEAEALLPRGTKQTIESVYKQGDTLVVELY